MPSGGTRGGLGGCNPLPSDKERKKEQNEQKERKKETSEQIKTKEKEKERKTEMEEYRRRRKKYSSFGFPSHVISSLFEFDSLSCKSELGPYFEL